MPPLFAREDLEWKSRDHQYDDLEPLVTVCMMMLGIDDYNVITQAERLDPGNLAETKMLPHNREAVITFDLDQLGPSVMRTIDSVIHEVVHLLLFPYEMVQLAMSNYFADHELVGISMFDSVWTNANERTVEAIARMLSKGRSGVNLRVQLMQWAKPYRDELPEAPPIEWNSQSALASAPGKGSHG